MKRKESYFLLACVLIILVYLSPYFIWGQNCRIKIGDNLDSNVPWLKVMADNVHHLGWNYDVAPQVMNGIPKMSLGSQMNVIFLLYLLFPPFVAYVLNLYMLHFIAFAGMVLLLKKIIPKMHEKEYLIIYGTALCFSLLNFWPSGGLSIAGQPLLLYALLSIKAGKFKPWYYIVIALFPFYSSLVLVGVFLILVLFAWIVRDWFYSKRNHPQFYWAILLLVAFYGVAEYELIKAFVFSSGFVSHRVEFYIPGLSFWKTVIASIKLELFGLGTHADVFQFPLLLLVIIGAIVFTLFKKRGEANIFYILIGISLCFSFLSGFFHWSGWDSLKQQITFLKTFDLSRFSFLLPMTIYLLFFYSLLILFKKGKRRIVWIIVILLIQIGLEFKRNSMDRTLYGKARSLVSSTKISDREFTYRNYYSEALFNKVKEFLKTDPSEYRVLCLGIEPGVLMYNGFYTLDAYVANYPLSYKMKFRRVMARELGKSEALRKMFDNFGSTCYLYSSEIGLRTITRHEDLKIRNLELNQEALKEIGCNYIFSTVEIENYRKSKWVSLGHFEELNSNWRIYIYKV